MRQGTSKGKFYAPLTSSLKPEVFDGKPTVNDNWVAKSATFDGTDDFIDCGNNSSLQLTDDIMVEATLVSLSASGDKMIVSKYDTAGGQRAHQLALQAGKLNVVLSDDGSSGAGHLKNYTSAEAITAGDKVGFSFTGDALKLYINDVDITDTATKTTDDAITAIHNSTTNLRIGARNETESDFYAGQISNVRITNLATSTVVLDMPLTSNLEDRTTNPHDISAEGGLTLDDEEFVQAREKEVKDYNGDDVTVAVNVPKFDSVVWTLSVGKGVSSSQFDSKYRNVVNQENQGLLPDDGIAKFPATPIDPSEGSIAFSFVSGTEQYSYMVQGDADDFYIRYDKDTVALEVKGATTATFYKQLVGRKKVVITWSAGVVTAYADGEWLGSQDITFAGTRSSYLHVGNKSDGTSACASIRDLEIHEKELPAEYAKKLTK